MDASSDEAAISFEFVTGKIARVRRQPPQPTAIWRRSQWQCLAEATGATTNSNMAVVTAVAGVALLGGCDSCHNQHQYGDNDSGVARRRQQPPQPTAIWRQQRGRRQPTQPTAIWWRSQWHCLAEAKAATTNSNMAAVTAAVAVA